MFSRTLFRTVGSPSTVIAGKTLFWFHARTPVPLTCGIWVEVSAVVADPESSVTLKTLHGSVLVQAAARAVPVELLVNGTRTIRLPATAPSEDATLKGVAVVGGLTVFSVRPIGAEKLVVLACSTVIWSDASLAPPSTMTTGASVNVPLPPELLYWVGQPSASGIAAVP